MSKLYRVAIVGATGAVGQEMLRLLEQRKFPIKKIRCFATLRSQGKLLPFRGEKIPVEALLNTNPFHDLDIAFFCAGSKAVKHYAPLARRSSTLLIDTSSAYRMDKEVPLVIPEINLDALKNHQGIIASPNCSATIMLMAIAPLHRHVKIKRIVATTYQAASGAGKAVMKELEDETKAILNNQPYKRSVLPVPYAFNLFTHDSPLQDNGYVEEELKMLFETRKILNDESINIAATCVRVPILRAHSLALNIEFTGPVSKEKAYEILKGAPGVTILEDRSKNRFPMPHDASGQDHVYCGRIREDYSQPNTLDLWVVGDQLLKGAALNAVQIAEHLIA